MPKSNRSMTKLREGVIDRIYRKNCSGIKINILDISSIFRKGMDALEAGQTEEELTKTLVDYVQSIRKN